MIAALLIGRKGSSRIKNKNLLKVSGRPIMEYPMMAAKYSKYVDSFYVSTDDERIEKIARPYGYTHIKRPAYLASNKSLAEDVYVHAYKYICRIEKDVKYLVLLSCNAATLLNTHIDYAIEALENDKTIDSAATVSMYNMWSPLRARKIVDGMIVPFVPPSVNKRVFGKASKLSCDRGSSGDTYFADAALFVIRPRNLRDIKNGHLPYRWLGRKTVAVKNWGGCDLDEKWQVPQIEYWLEDHGFTKNTTPYSKE